MDWNLNPLAAVTWTWRAVRGNSLTFAVLFALGLLGVSVVTEFRHLLDRLGAPWYAWFLVPMVGIAWLARKEADWVPDVQRRKLWARLVMVGSIVVAILIAKFGPSK